MTLALAVLPIVFIIALGYGLAKSDLLPRADWKGIETLSFRVLIPAVLILTITRTEMSVDRFGTAMLALMLTWALVAAGIAMLRVLPHHVLPNASFTTLFQTGTRWNAFVALAAAEQLGGADAMGLLAVAIALLIPTINVSCILMLSGFGPIKSSTRQIAMTVVKNPLVQACALGIVLALTGLSLPQPVTETLDMIGRGALAVGLLAVGAGISLRRLTRARVLVALGVMTRPVLAPCVFAGIATLLGAGPMHTLGGVLVFAAPAASNGYIIAKQMGGDADLYADVLTWQTLLSLIVLPLWAWVLL